MAIAEAGTSFKPKPDGSCFDAIAQDSHPCRQIIVNPRIERFAQFQHPAIVNSKVAFTLLIPGHVADEGMDMEIGIIGTAGFMLEKSRDHLTRWLGHFLVGQFAAPVPDGDEGFKPAQFLFDGLV